MLRLRGQIDIPFSVLKPRDMPLTCLAHPPVEWTQKQICSLYIYIYLYVCIHIYIYILCEIICP